MRRSKTISRDDQVALARRAQAGDLAARNALVVATTGIVYSVAKRWEVSSPGLELDDLAAEGALGVMRAIETFDCDRGIAFTTYAANWVKHFVRLAHEGDVGIKRSDSARVVLVLDVRRLVAAGESRESAIAAVAEARGKRYSTVLEVLEAHERGRPRSLDAPMPGGDGASLADVLPGHVPDPASRIDGARRDRAVRRAVDRCVAAMSPRERAIAERRLLCDAEDAVTLAEIGGDFSISRERVRQIEIVVRERLRAALAAVHVRYGSSGRQHHSCRECGRQRCRDRRARARQLRAERAAASASDGLALVEPVARAG